jgi:hypothetical protein
MPSEPGLKESFFADFQYAVTALQEQIARLSTTSCGGSERTNAIDDCLAGISRLSYQVKDASSYIPAHDQRTYADAVKALSERLQAVRSTFAPQKKFQFKTTRKNISAFGLAHSGESIESTPTPSRRMDCSEDKGVDSGITIADHNGSHISLPTSPSNSASSGTILNIRHSVIHLLPYTPGGSSFATLTLRNIKDSLIICGKVAGPIHITGVEDSVLVTACRQFRMHSSSNVDVYLHCTSRPIIEDCRGIRFAPMPSTYIPQDISRINNQYDQIDDFKWLKAGPSPHFSVLPEAERIDEEAWKITVPSGRDPSLDDILRAVAVVQGAATVEQSLVVDSSPE